MKYLNGRYFWKRKILPSRGDSGLVDWNSLNHPFLHFRLHDQSTEVNEDVLSASQKDFLLNSVYTITFSQNSEHFRNKCFNFLARKEYFLGRKAFYVRLSEDAHTEKAQKIALQHIYHIN